MTSMTVSNEHQTLKQTLSHNKNTEFIPTQQLSLQNWFGSIHAVKCLYQCIL